MTSFIIAGNWKMNKTPQETMEFIKIFKSIFKPRDGRDVLFFPSYLSINTFKQEFQGTPVLFGAQNCHFESSGAYTGEVSAIMLNAFGVQYCLVGHSERRTLFGETNADTAKKVKALQALNMTPILCIGETEQQRSEGKTLQVIEQQLEAGFSAYDKTKKLVLAYEPVWAIGTGKVATPKDVEVVHKFINEWTTKKYSQAVPILYGGSVSEKNSKELESVPHVNGFLIGGASLKPDSLMAIYG
jgi:triosephosphate isomerase (TIM)